MKKTLFHHVGSTQYIEILFTHRFDSACIMHRIRMKTVLFSHSAFCNVAT